MRIASRLNLFLLLVLFSASRVAARQIDSGAHPGDRIYLDVVASQPSGAPVHNLQQQDFEIFDNDTPQRITSFQAIDRARAQINVTIVLDALTISPRVKATALEDIKRFLNANEGELAYPTAVDFVTNKGLEFRAGASRDGQAIRAALEKNAIAIQDIGDTARSFAVFDALVELVTLERDKPGRKLIVFVSPGWLPVVRPDFEHKASEREVQQLRLQMFGNIVQLTRQLHEGQIIVYSLDPPAVDDVDSGFTNGTTHLRSSHIDVNVAGARSPSDVRWGDLALQTLALQSGGLALYSGNDLASSLRECLADASAFYELFDPVITDQRNQYHQVRVQIAQPDLTARTRQGYYSQPWPAARFAAEEAKLSDTNTAEPQVPDLDMRDASEVRAKNLTAQAPTYVDMSLEQLTKQIPELKDLRPAQDQKQLFLLLKNTGRAVDAFIHNVGDLIADEDLTQQKLNPDGKIKAKQRTQDDYLILQHGYEWGANSEYRMDKRGNRLESIGLLKGFLVTAGYALNCITFSTIYQPQSNFRYLGDQTLGTREAFVVSFAQRPGDATFKTVMRGAEDSDVEMLTQGILWIDKNSFQILRLRTDLLAPNAKLRLRKITTNEDFGEVRLQNNPDPLWLPNDVTVFIEIGGEKYRNLHHYTNYRRYQVAVKIGNS